MPEVTPKIQFRGSLGFRFLGKDYDLMKPSLDKQVYVLVKKLEGEDGEVDIEANKAEIADLLKDEKLVIDKSGKDKPLEANTVSDYIKEFTITRLAVVIHKDEETDTNHILFQLGAEIKFHTRTLKKNKTKDDPNAYNVKEGIGWGDLFRLNDIKVFIERDFNEEDREEMELDGVQQQVIDALEAAKHRLEEERELEIHLEEIQQLNA